MATTTKKPTKKVEKKPEGVNGLAVSGFVLSLCGFFTGITFVIGLILSAVGLAKTKKTGQEGRGLALAGTIIGAIGTGVGLISIIILVIVGVFAAVNSDTIIDTVKNAESYYEDCDYDYEYNPSTRSYHYVLECD